MHVIIYTNLRSSNDLHQILYTFGTDPGLRCTPGHQLLFIFDCPYKFLAKTIMIHFLYKLFLLI